MTFHADAIYEGGVLRPLEPLDLQEHELVTLSISKAASAGSASESEGSRQRGIVMAHVAKVEARGDQAPNDGLSNRDHDRLIYGQ